MRETGAVCDETRSEEVCVTSRECETEALSY
jgi:hypothetical protein